MTERNSRRDLREEKDYLQILETIRAILDFREHPESPTYPSRMEVIRECGQLFGAPPLRDFTKLRQMANSETN
jgi:hypothetical protein